MKKNILILLLAIPLFLIGCSENEIDDPITPASEKEVASCIGCHTNYTHLKAVYTPDPIDPGGGGGCGGDIPHIEPYDRVYMSGSGYDQFKNTVHGKIPCVSCHNGVDNTANKDSAHSGNFVVKPSRVAEEKCGSCHSSIVTQAKDNIHSQGWGQKSMVALRSGLGDVPAGFDQLSDLMKTGYEKNCAKCHASCGDCHVNRPVAGGGGLLNGHQFSKTPDMRNVCVTCHTSRGGHAYFGQGAGTVPDVHLEKRQFTCMNCHSKNEIHGDGKIYDQRYKVASLPKCTDCHANINTSNLFHTMHVNSTDKALSCNTCHSQDYNNCGSCHIGGDGARIPAYLGYKLGMNPIKSTKPKFDFALLRRSLMAPDSWQNYGVAALPNFNIRPTFKYTTPHNITKITTRTGFKNNDGNWVVYSNCTQACHISKNPDGSFNNKELYLFDADCAAWEKAANVNIVVDGKLPASWQAN